MPVCSVLLCRTPWVLIVQVMACPVRITDAANFESYDVIPWVFASPCGAGLRNFPRHTKWSAPVLIDSCRFDERGYARSILVSQADQGVDRLDRTRHTHTRSRRTNPRKKSLNEKKKTRRITFQFRDVLLPPVACHFCHLSLISRFQWAPRTCVTLRVGVSKRRVTVDSFQVTNFIFTW